MVLWQVPVCCGRATHARPHQTTRRARTAAQAPARAYPVADCSLRDLAPTSRQLAPSRLLSTKSLWTW